MKLGALSFLAISLIALLTSANAQSPTGNDPPVWCSCWGHFTDRQAGKRYFITSFVFNLSDRIAVTSCKTSTNDFRTSVEIQYPVFRRTVAPVWCTYSFKKKEAVTRSRKRLNDAGGDSYFAKAFAFGYAGEGEPIAGRRESLGIKSTFCDDIFLKKGYQKLGEGRYCGKATDLFVLCEDSGKKKSNGDPIWSMDTISGGC